MAEILIVLEEVGERAQVTHALECDGHTVVAVSGLPHALTQVRTGHYDLAVVEEPRDSLDRGSECELLAALRTEAPELALLWIARSPIGDGAASVTRLGVRQHLTRPVEAETIAASVRGALAHRVGELPVRRSPEAETAVFQGIVGRSRPIRDLFQLVGRIAETDSTVLITGETGTGKELIGRAIHQAGRRRSRIFCAVNSAAFPETLLESELFGHTRGAFTGASATKKGLFEAANQGTVFLDEVAEMPLTMQAKLLRFLQTGELRPVGSETSRCVDVRLVTATNKNLEQEVEEGRFREDLYYRLAVIPVHVPPLRERREDIPLLAEYFLGRFARNINKRIEGLAPEALDVLCEYDWPGNVRQLENTIESGVALCQGRLLMARDFPLRLRERRTHAPSHGLESLESLERNHILRTLEHTGWNRKQAAEILKISTTTLWRRLKDFGIDKRAAAGRA